MREQNRTSASFLRAASAPPTCALIIPSVRSDLEPLLESIRRQTIAPAEIEIVRGVAPSGRARNCGVAQTDAPFLIFVDDDAVLGDQNVLANLVALLLNDLSIGVAGASKVLPANATRFQRWVAREVPRIVHPLVSAPFETNPDPPFFYCEITTTCCALRREVFEEIGGFDEHLLRGADTDFFVRVRRRGYRLVLAANTWTYHPAPATPRTLLQKHFEYGMGHAQEVRHDPSRARGDYLVTPFHALVFLLFRTAILAPNILLPYSYAAPKWHPGFKPLKALTSYASALGYVWGWYRVP